MTQLFPGPAVGYNTIAAPHPHPGGYGPPPAVAWAASAGQTLFTDNGPRSTLPAAHSFAVPYPERLPGPPPLPTSQAAEDWFADARRRLDDNEYYARASLVDGWAGDVQVLAELLLSSYLRASLLALQRRERQARGACIREEAALRQRALDDTLEHRPIHATTRAHAENLERHRRHDVAALEDAEFAAAAAAFGSGRSALLHAAFSDREAARRADAVGYEAVDRRSLLAQAAAGLSAAAGRECGRCEPPARAAVAAGEAAEREGLRAAAAAAGGREEAGRLEAVEARFRAVVEHDWGAGLATLAARRRVLHLFVLEGLEAQWREYHEREWAATLWEVGRAARVGCEGRLPGEAGVLLAEEEEEARWLVEDACAGGLGALLEAEEEARAAAGGRDAAARARAARRGVREGERRAEAAGALREGLAAAEEEERVRRGGALRASGLVREHLFERASLERRALSDLAARAVFWAGEMREALRVERLRWVEWEQRRRRGGGAVAGSMSGAGGVMVVAGGELPAGEPLFYESHLRRAAVREVQGSFMARQAEYFSMGPPVPQQQPFPQFVAAMR